MSTRAGASAPPRQLRVVQWYTGQIAQEQIRLISKSRDLQLVGGVCWNPEKDGVDLGTLAGIDTLGVAASCDETAALAIDADIVLFNSFQPQYDTVIRMLESGKNVISLLGPWDVRADPALAKVDAAARANGVSVFGAGNIPGIVNDLLPLTMCGFLQNVRSIYAGERNFHNRYNSARVLREQIGYGLTEAEHSLNTARGAAMRAVYTSAFHQSHYTVASALGWLANGETLESWMAPTRLALAESDIRMEAADYTVKKGTVAGVCYRIDSFISGVQRISTELEHSCQPGVAPGWRGPDDEAEFFFEIDADPPLKGGWRMVDEAARLTGTVHLNAARNINLIPNVVAARPGNVTFTELPPVFPAAMKSGQ